MTKEEIILANKMLYVFLGHSKDIPITDKLAMALGFHYNWKMLMSVVEKIEAISVDRHLQYEVQINGCNCRIINRSGDVLVEYENERKKIDAVYFTSVHFVKWYDEINKVKHLNTKQ